MFGLVIFIPAEKGFDGVTDLLPSEAVVCKCSALVAMVILSPAATASCGKLVSASLETGTVFC